MKFSLTSSELLRNLQKAGGTISSNPVISILEDFLFEIEGGKLTISGTDLETSIRISMDVVSDEDGRIAIPGKMLVDTLKGLPEQPVTLDVNMDNYTLEITSANGKYRLACDNPADYPDTPEHEGKVPLSVDASVVHHAIQSTSFATSMDELRLAMTGVKVVVDFNKLIWVATDAHKLVRYTIKDTTADETASFILPRKSLSVINAALPASGQVDIAYTTNHAFFRSGDTYIAIRLIDARYPEYEAVIPKENNQIATISRKDLLASLKRIIIYANKTTNQVVFSLAENSLTIQAQDIDFSNEASEQLACSYAGEPMKIGFNAKFLIEMLGVLSDDEILIKLQDSTKAGIMLPVEQSDPEDILMLIMPVMMNY